MMNLVNVRIVLVGTTHPGNIGSAARAMKTMGLSDLVLVSPKSFPDLRAVELSAGADDIVHAATVVASLDEALVGCTLVFGTSARPRGLSLPGVTPDGCAALIRDKKPSKAAIIFGREHSGLTNEELMHCHYHVHIPANEAYSSLNLAMAVQIICYEIRKYLLQPDAHVALSEDTLASHELVTHFYEHLYEVLSKIDFIKPSNPHSFQRMKRLFNRAQLETMEVHMLRGILTQIQRNLKEN